MTSLGISLRSAVVVAFAAAASVALAALVRNAIAVVTIVVMWPLILDPLLPSLIPGSGEAIAGLLPFVNARHFIGLGANGADIPWGPGGAGLYFTIWMVGLLALGVLATNRTAIR